MERKLTISGKGQVAVSPDIIVISFNAEARAWEYSKTVAELNQKVENLRALVERVGVDRKQVKTKDFSIQKSTNWNKKLEKHEFNGFKATHALELELPLERDLINTLLAKVSKEVESLDFRIAFGVKDAREAQQRAILEAIAKAKENAALIAQATGVQLQEILDIDFSYREITLRSKRHDYPLYEADAMTLYEPTLDFEPDDIDLNETVTIVWRIA
ncbi:SIMPL domain-containing protein [Rufibacter sp. LB8]|uniref:SIMPL domain-containing protein n=1 Tax=Rufibacter sp. LB8 TaxID=2777781 RepID=UPI00178C19A8|nr:SIMPL domain-containing protein [Rufibacter sp. LB8]